MSKEDDDIMAAWGDALNEQAAAEGKNSSGDDSEHTPASDDDVMAAWGDAFAESESKSNIIKDDPEAETVPLEDFGDAPPPMNKAEKRRLEAILDIPVVVSMEVGRSKISIRNLLQLNQGSVIELDRLAGEPLDILVNGTLIAHGEVVVVNDKFGIRLTDVISQIERIKKLK